MVLSAVKRKYRVSEIRMTRMVVGRVHASEEGSQESFSEEMASEQKWSRSEEPPMPGLQREPPGREENRRLVSALGECVVTQEQQGGQHEEQREMGVAAPSLFLMLQGKESRLSKFVLAPSHRDMCITDASHRLQPPLPIVASSWSCLSSTWVTSIPIPQRQVSSGCFSESGLAGVGGKRVARWVEKPQGAKNRLIKEVARRIIKTTHLLQRVLQTRLHCVTLRRMLKKQHPEFTARKSLPL